MHRGGWADRAAAEGTSTPFDGAFVIDPFARFMKLLILGGAPWRSLLAFDEFLRNKGLMKFEYPILVLLSTVGMMMMVSANDLIALYLGLELQSLALYVLRRLSAATTSAPAKPASSISSSARCRRACCSTAPR